jgi:hypothetical protein
VADMVDGRLMRSVQMGMKHDLNDRMDRSSTIGMTLGSTLYAGPISSAGDRDVEVTVDVGPLRPQNLHTTEHDASALDAAIAKLVELPPEEQDRIARWLLDELEDEGLWTRQFAASQAALSKLAAEARADLAAGRTTELDPDQL